MKYFVWLMWMVTATSVAQNPLFYELNEEKGLPDFEQYCIWQDKQDYIWCGGKNGLVKYNGNDFIPYTNSSLGAQTVIKIQEDPWGHIWVCDINGNIFYTDDQNNLHLFEGWKSSDSRTIPNITIIKNRLVITYEEGIKTYLLSSNADSTKLIFEKKITNSKNCIFYKNRLYLSGLDEVYRLNSAGDTDTLTLEPGNIPHSLTAWSFYIPLGQELYLFIRAEKKIMKLEGGCFKKLKEIDIPADIQNVQIIQGEVWMMTPDGIFILDKNLHIKSHLFKGIPCTHVIRDKRHAYWITTTTRGILFMPDLHSAIYQTPDNRGYTKMEIWKNQLVAGSNDGNIYTLKEGKIEMLNNNEGGKQVNVLYKNPANDELIWGSQNIFSMNTKGVVQDIGVNPGIKKLWMLKNSVYLIADPGGLYFTSFGGQEINPGILPDFIQTLLNDAKKKPAASNQLYILNERTNGFYIDTLARQILAFTKTGIKLIKKEGIKNLHFHGQPVYANAAIKLDAYILLTTHNMGLFIYTNEQLVKITQIDGIKMEAAKRVAVYGKQVWITCDGNVYAFTLQNGRIRFNGIIHHTLTKRIEDMLYWQGNLYISSARGLEVVDAEFFQPKTTPPPFYIAYLKSDKGNTRNGHTFLPGTKHLTIGFDILAYDEPLRYRLQYTLQKNGVKNRLDPGKTEIELYNLHPGDYTLKVELIDIFTTQTAGEKTISFHIGYYFWQTWWFKLLIIVCGVVLASGGLYIWQKITRRKNQRLLEKEMLQKELKNSSLAAIKAQMNPHFIFNALNTIQSYILKNDRMTANFYLGKFSDLMRLILDMSNRENITIEEEIDALKLYLDLENMRLDGTLQYTIECNKESDLLHIRIPSMIIQPYVENAIKHGLLHLQKQKVLHILFEKKENSELLVTISDNGIGRAQARMIRERQGIRYKSFSTESNKKRLELLNENKDKKIVVGVHDQYPGEKDCGTVVVLHIPTK